MAAKNCLAGSFFALKVVFMEANILGDMKVSQHYP
jgi:hypothetical protein